MEQVLFGGYFNNPPDRTNTEYNSILGGTVWGVTEANVHQLVSTDGYIKNLRVDIFNDPGAGNKYTFTVMLNGAPTALTLDISDAETSGSNMVNTVDVTGGDLISLQCDPDDYPDTVYVIWTTVFEGDNAKESLIMGGSTGALNNGATEYGQIMGVTTQYSVTENNFRQVIPTDGTLKNLYVLLSADPGTDPDAYRFTVRLNGASPGGGLVITITADDVTGNDLANDIDVVAGDVVTMMIEPLNGPSETPDAHWGMTFVADIDGESIVLGGCTDNLNDTNTEYNFITGYEGRVWNVIEVHTSSLGQVCTLKKLHMLLSAAPGAGNDYDFAIRISGTNVVTLQISDAETTGDSGGLSDTVALDETVNLMCTPTDTPDVVDAYWGFVCYISPPSLGFPVIGSIVEAMTEIVYGDDD